jgi:hypothetical protein
MEPLRVRCKGAFARAITVAAIPVVVIAYIVIAITLSIVIPASLAWHMAKKKRRSRSKQPPRLYCPSCLGDDAQPVLSLLRIRLVRAGANSVDIDGSERLSVSYHLDCERCNYMEVYSFEEFGRIYRGESGGESGAGG